MQEVVSSNLTSPTIFPGTLFRRVLLRKDGVARQVSAMRTILAKNKRLLAALALYVCSYAILWGSREETMFALTVDRGCVQKSRVKPALRFAWMESSSLGPVLSVVYWPVNALRLSQTEWR